MSQVWRGVDTVLGRTVAVKTLAPALVADPRLREAVRREARAAAQLAHPHVMQVYDFGEAALDDGVVVPFLVMELLEGDTLADRLRSGPLPWPDAVRIGADVAAALAAAHRLGIVHRDVKPGNVVITPAGPKVLDFGIAALTGATGATVTGPTAIGEVVLAGTPAYAAPEALRGEPPSPASDVYGLGALLFEMLTGAPPSPATTWAEAVRADAARSGSAPPDLAVPQLPEPVRELCLACLSREPDNRPTSGRVARSLLAAAAPAEPALGRARVVRAPAVPRPTLLERVAPPPDGGAAPVPPRPGALVAHRWGTGLAAAAAFALLAALLALGAAMLFTARTPFSPGAGGATTPTPPATTTPPATQPANTAGELIGALQARIEQAITAGEVSSETAFDLLDDVRDLRERLDRGRLRDITKRADNLRDRVEQRAEDDRITATLAADLDELLQRLIRLSGD
jgi:serine/threonine-protein kinase